jgi:hypothetical protein
MQETSTDATVGSINSTITLAERIDICVKTNENSMLNEPIYVGRLKNIEILNEYCLQDNVPLLPKFLFLDDDSLDLFIIELPTEIHEYVARHIFKQLVKQSDFIDSVGSGRRNHMEADERIRPSPRTPNLQLAQGVSLSTLVIEVGLSQKWKGRGGLDEKARKWFQSRNSIGLQYILCVKIDFDDGAITDFSYKLYDLQMMDRFQVLDATHLLNGENSQIQLDARRVLSIPINQSLPQEFHGNTIFINLEMSRDDVILAGL